MSYQLAVSQIAVSQLLVKVVTLHTVRPDWVGSGEEGDSFVFLFENFSGVQTAQVGKKIVI